jgi:hypothetical protein
VNLPRRNRLWLYWLLAATGSLLVGACGKVEPLPAPLPQTHVVADGLRLWLADGDLPALAESARQATGLDIPVALAPWSIPATGGAVLAGQSTAVRLLSAKAEWQSEDVLELAFVVQPPVVPLAVGYPGSAACGLTWRWTEAEAAVRLEVLPGPFGEPQVTLAAPAVLAGGAPQLDDPKGCLQGLAAQTVAAIEGHVDAQLRSALLGQVAVSSVATLQAVAAPSWRWSGRWRDGSTVVDVESAFLPRQDNNTHLFGGPPGQRLARLAVGLQVAPAGCAPDLPPPQQVPDWPMYAPSPPSDPSLIRRGAAMSGALLSHLAWAALRSGAMCRSASGWGTGLGAGWAEAVVPELGAWVQSEPTLVQWWPGAVPEVDVVDGPSGVELSWRFDDTTVEIAAKVAGDEVVVLVVRGRIRVRTKVAAVSTGLRLEVTGVDLESAQVSSPLFGDTLPGTATGDVRAVISAAVKGIADELSVLQVGALLPQGAVVTGTQRAGSALWLWLDGAP